MLALLSVALVRTAAGEPSYFVCQLQDLSEQREVERVKGEFISSVSHELRTPLTSIRGSLGLILGALSSSVPPQVISLLEIANSNCERLLRLINDILDIDKIASGSAQQHGTQVRLCITDPLDCRWYCIWRTTRTLPKS